MKILPLKDRAFGHVIRFGISGSLYIVALAEVRILFGINWTQQVLAIAWQITTKVGVVRVTWLIIKSNVKVGNKTADINVLKLVGLEHVVRTTN